MSAKEMTYMPRSPTGNDDFCLNRRLATTTAWRENLMKVEMAVEAEGSITIVERCLPRLFFFLWKGCAVCTSLDPCKPSIASSIWFRIKGHAFKGLRTVIACEAVRMKALRGGTDDTPFDRKSARSALRCGTT